MSIALTEEHKALATTVADFLTKRKARETGRELLEATDDSHPAWWAEAARLGWLGLHLPESSGGSVGVVLISDRSLPRVEPVAQPVAHHVEAEDRQQDR